MKKSGLHKIRMPQNPDTQNQDGTKSGQFQLYFLSVFCGIRILCSCLVFFTYYIIRAKFAWMQVIFMFFYPLHPAKRGSAPFTPLGALPLRPHKGEYFPLDPLHTGAAAPRPRFFILFLFLRPAAQLKQKICLSYIIQWQHRFSHPQPSLFSIFFNITTTDSKMEMNCSITMVKFYFSYQEAAAPWTPAFFTFCLRRKHYDTWQ